MTSTPDGTDQLLAIENGWILTGDGTTQREGSLIVAAGKIVSVSRDSRPSEEWAFENATVVDVDGDVVMPGIVNSHMHQAFSTPSTASASPPPDAETVARTLDRHLLEGCTTVVNADAFALASERDTVSDHPLKVEFGSCATPLTKEAAIASGGELQDRHEALTIPEAVSSGAIVLGEVGSKNTLTGGIQREKYIPETLSEEIGVEFTPAEAERIVDAAVGRHADPDEHDGSAVGEVLAEMGLADRIEPEACRELVVDMVMPSIQATRDGFREVGDFAEALDLPMLVHTSAATKRVTGDLADRDLHLITGHINHPSFTAEEMFSFAEEMDAADGVTVEACVWDLFGDVHRDSFDVDEHGRRFLELIERDLVDILSTDYANGYWHGLMIAVREIVARDILSLPAAVALVTGNVAGVHPSIGATRGTLAPGKAADVLVVDREDVSDVKRVFVDGRQVVAGGERVEENV